MKLLDLFSTGTAGTAGTSQQGQGFPPSRFAGIETGQRDENAGTGLPAASSRPVRPGPNFMNGTGELVVVLSPSRSSRSSHSKIEQNISDSVPAAATPEEIAHARSLLVACPTTGSKLHCWHCSRCDDARKCTAWHRHRPDVVFFRLSEKPHSLYLVEDTAAVEVLR